MKSLWAVTKRSEMIFRASVSAVLTVLLVGAPVAPVWAQNPPEQQDQKPPQNPESTKGALPVIQSPANGPGPVTPPIPVSLGVSKYHFDHSPSQFPNLLAPYFPIGMPPLVLTNSPRLDQLVHDGKLEIGLQDAVELALENDLDIAIQRYSPWLADTNLLLARSGQQPFGVPGAEIAQSVASIPFLNFDPTVTAGITEQDNSTPVNNPFISGTGTSTVTGLASHSTQYTTQYTQGFSTGTTLTAQWNNTRSSSSSAVNFFNPAVQSNLAITISQQLLNGFGRFANRRNIIISENNRKLEAQAFAQQVITIVTNTITAYWELTFARENVSVQQQAVNVAAKLYSDNKKQLEIGTMAPLDVTQAESELATDKQNLIVAQTTKLQDEQNLKNFISKDPMAANLINVEIIPIDHPTPPEQSEAPSFEEAVKIAFANRPDLKEQEYNVQNAAVEARATGIALRPQLTLNATYVSQGLAGNSPISGTPVTVAGAPIVDANGNPIPGLFEPITTAPTTGIASAGLGTAQSQIFHNQFPDYIASLNLTLPLRNRAAQAVNQRALLTQQQIQTQMQQMRNAAILDVRNTYIALEQGRAQVEAATEARKLQQQTFDAEQKKYQLGASTVYNVILTQRDLINAQGTELRALANLQEAKANYERATGRTLDVNRITIANSKTGETERDTLIPGTLHGKVVGTEKLWTDKSILSTLDGQR